MQMMAMIVYVELATLEITVRQVSVVAASSNVVHVTKVPFFAFFQRLEINFRYNKIVVSTFGGNEFKTHILRHITSLACI